MNRFNKIDYWLKCFIYAGSSAALFAVAHLYQDLWFISLIALIPFLWRTTRISLTSSMITAVLFALSYFLTIVPMFSGLSTGSIILQLVGLNVIFVAYAALVNRTTHLVRFNAALIALLWLPFEFILKNCLGMNDVFTFAIGDSAILIRIGSLFGVLIITVLIVLVNSLIIVMITHLICAPGKRRKIYSVQPNIVCCFFPTAHFKRPRFHIPVLRGPPAFPSLFPET